jgi:FdhE protein
MSLLRDAREGKRYLHCSLCESEWTFKRLSCAVCGNQEASTMGYFTTGEESPYRVDYCDRCKNYIKTRRLSKSAGEDEFDLTVENVLTVDLDGLLVERGYSRP